jgi:hypothetical protein
MDDGIRLKAAELTAQIVAARVGAAAGRPNAAEARDAADYIRIVHAEVLRTLGVSDPGPE